jgi:thioester reductase-like protein
MKYFLTGATGFIGAHGLAETLYHKLRLLGMPAPVNA